MECHASLSNLPDWIHRQSDLLRSHCPSRHSSSGRPFTRFWGTSSPRGCVASFRLRTTAHNAPQHTGAHEEVQTKRSGATAETQM
jgi:hypothetical protein